MPHADDDDTNKETEQASAFPALSFDPAEYRHFLEDCGWTDVQKDAFTEALWQIVVGVIDMEFGVHPIQQAMGNAIPLAEDSPAMLPSEDNSDTTNITFPPLTGAGVKEDS